MSFIKEFKQFALKGNLVDIAVAFVMGGAFGKVVSSFTDKSNLTDDAYKEAIAGTGFEVIKVVSVERIITEAEEARKLVD